MTDSGKPRYHRAEGTSFWTVAGTPFLVYRQRRVWRLGLSAQLLSPSDHGFARAISWLRVSGLEGPDVTFASRDSAARAVLAQIAVRPFPFALAPQSRLVRQVDGTYRSADRIFHVSRAGRRWLIVDTRDPQRRIHAMTLEHARQLINIRYDESS